MRGYSVRTALSCDVPETVDAETTEVMRNCIDKVEREFYRPVQFLRLKDESKDDLYQENAFKEYAPIAVVPCNIINNPQALSYLPIGIREQSDVALEMAEIELERLGYKIDTGRDIFIVDGIRYKIIFNNSKDIIKDVYVNRLVTGQNMNTLQVPNEPASPSRATVEKPFEDLP
jgi:hypothetical protein